ncbi:MAG TPA: hypothetical protein VJO53_12645 [Candidatus Acidoferrales bacterium]|nr:hypothetical protein [Candidatus Acidoferrales bacterium]
MSLHAAVLKKPEELVVRYRLEPTVREIFVEGKSDAGVITRFLRSIGRRDVTVYEISSVHIPADSVIASGQPDNVRGRVIYLAFRFQAELAAGSRAATCVADRDYDLVLGREYRCPFLLFIDHSCLEMYAFNAEAIDPLLQAIAPTLGKNGNVVLAELHSLLQQLFAIRATNILLGLGLEWLPSFSDSCTLTENSVEFDQNGFIERYLNKNGLLKHKDGFLRALEEIRSRMEGDPRLFIRGHDFVHCLSWYLRAHASKSSPLHRPEILGELLLAYLEPSLLSATRFFRKLAERINDTHSELS